MQKYTHQSTRSQKRQTIRADWRVFNAFFLPESGVNLVQKYDLLALTCLCQNGPIKRFDLSTVK